MNMSSMSSMHDMNLQNDMSNMSNMNGISPHSDNTIVNQTEQSAQAYTVLSQSILNKYLKLNVLASNSTSALSELERELAQLKSRIVKKDTFMDVMNIIHIKIHPVLIAAYKLPLRQ